ncbi:MAG: hypothetical protein KAR83_06710 [Thermodesulfovibrionales bacterium]|nr:hypothetical protein [Thermodesulfovibrionales bacterium]
MGFREEVFGNLLNMNGSDSVPVIVDATRGKGKGALIRCVYLTIEGIGPSADWTLHLQNTKIPYIMLGFSGIIHRPIKGRTFNSLKRITDLVEAIEKQGEFFMDTNGVWLPRWSFKKAPRGGDVWRVPLGTFKFGLMYSEGRLDDNVFAEGFDGMDKMKAEHSASETKAFAAWEKKVILMARDSYYEKKHMALGWKKAEGER